MSSVGLGRGFLRGLGRRSEASKAPQDENVPEKPRTAKDKIARGTGAHRRGPFADITNGTREDKEREREERERRRVEQEEKLEREQLRRELLEQERQERQEREARERERERKQQEEAEAQRARERELEAEQAQQAREPRWVRALHAVDQPVAHDPLWVAEYAEDVFERMRLQELQPDTQLAQGEFLSKQEVITDKMRAILVDWLVEVHLKFKLSSNTLFLTVALLDRFLAKKSVQRSQLQLLGVTCLLLAAKYEEVYAPEVRDFVSITDRAYTRREIIDMEVTLLTVLNFRLTLPSPALFLKRFSRLLGDDTQLELLAQYILELSLVDYRMQKYTASHLASASLLLANKVMKKVEAWPAALSKASHTTEQSLRPCAKEMCALLQGAEKSSLQAVRKKYSAEKYGSVAKLLTP